MKKITVQDIEDVVGFEVSDNVKALINEFDHSSNLKLPV